MSGEEEISDLSFQRICCWFCVSMQLPLCKGRRRQQCCCQRKKCLIIWDAADDDGGGAAENRNYLLASSPMIAVYVEVD